MDKDKEKILEAIELTEEQSKAYVEKLNEWKAQVEEQKNKELDLFKSEVEKKTEEKYNSLFEESKAKLQIVYANRLEEATKELYDVVKERNMKDLQESQEYQLIHKIKSLVAPFVIEKGMQETVESKTDEVNALKSEINKLQAVKKFEILSKDLEEAVREELKKLIGEMTSEEHVVEEFNKAIKIMKLTKTTLESEGYKLENIDPVSTDRELPSSERAEELKKKKKKVDESVVSEEAGPYRKKKEAEESSESETSSLSDDSMESTEVPENGEKGEEGDDEESSTTSSSTTTEEDSIEDSESSTPVPGKKKKEMEEGADEMIDDALSEEDGAVVTKGKQDVINETVEETEYDSEIKRMRHLANVGKKK